MMKDKKAIPVTLPDGTIENFMPKIGGELFKCRCGCNIFHKPDRDDPDIYECNACGNWYEDD